MKSHIHIPSDQKEQLDKMIQKSCKKELIKQIRVLCSQMDAAALYILHEEFGFGEQRLRRFWELLGSASKALEEKYEMPGEFQWLALEMLKRDGINVDEWQEEIKDEDFRFVGKDMPWYKR